MSAKTMLRCAIYTRKSTEEGLDQAFNSLDAQREACAAYIASQVGLGWKLIPEYYDDGGISGGTMERPALQRLLADISLSKVDVVVVYKIDRLTRSLMDFARIVEIFDRENVSFVSITQQFNTTTSMGRLTLNVLLSFAQFEREVTAERIRDKIAASKRKGMWMGGTVPLGYRVENRKLIIDPPAAAEVKRLFTHYLELGSVPALAIEINRPREDNHDSTSLIHADTGQGRRKPATKISTGKLYYMLANPIYIGQVRHGSEVYPGEHEPIIDRTLFEAVQARLADQAPRARGSTVQRDSHLLNGLIFDETGDGLSPIHATKGGKRYRYYISARLKDGKAGNKDGWRIPAGEIEAIVLQQMKVLLYEQAVLSSWMQVADRTACIEAGLVKAAQACLVLDASTLPDPLRGIIRIAIKRIDLTSNRIRVAINKQAVACWLADGASKSLEDERPTRTTSDRSLKRSAGYAPTSSAQVDEVDLHIVDLPLSIRQRGVERRLVIEGQSTSLRRLDQPLIDTVARAHVYLEALTDGSGNTRKDVAQRFGVHPEDVSRLLPLAFLSPRIIEAILTGQQPADLSVRHLARNIDLPINWAEQAKLLAA